MINSFIQGNPNLCIGCRTCMIGCVVAHEGKHIFEIDPDSYDFHPRLKVIKTYTVSVPVQCKHCENPACMSVCKSGAISRVEGAVKVDTAKCIGCKSCADSCPFGAIEMVTLKNVKNADGNSKCIANKCDMCEGIKGGPTCVRVCPTEALKHIQNDDIAAAVAKKRAGILGEKMSV